MNASSGVAMFFATVQIAYSIDGKVHRGFLDAIRSSGMAGPLGLVFPCIASIL
jgi:hypothetical protein